MTNDLLTAPPGVAPASEDTRTRREKARAAGPNADHWYAVEHAAALRLGQVHEVRFWGTSIALYRGRDGSLGAVENRCAHRHVPLTLGEVTDCRLVCKYHGWGYAADGRLAEIPHDLFGRSFPSVRIRSYPVRTRYGLIWIFPGDPARADAVAIPDVPDLDATPPWSCAPFDLTIPAHWSILVENLLDLTHEFLHRGYNPFVDCRLSEHGGDGDRAWVRYRVKPFTGLAGLLANRKRLTIDTLEICFEYPFVWENTGGGVKARVFILPVDARTTRAFFLFHTYDAVRVPFTTWPLPRVLLGLALRLANRFYFKPLFSQDAVILAAEQRAHEIHIEKATVELNPAMRLIQNLIVDRWERSATQEGQ
jgi:hypothetical protein